LDNRFWIFLKNLDLARILLLGQKRIGGRILNILAFFSLFQRLCLENFKDLVIILLNCTKIYCLKDILFLTISLSQPDSYIVKMNSYIAKPNLVIWGISFSDLFSSFHCLMKVAILSSEHMIFLKSPLKYLFMPKRKIKQKLLSHNYKSASWFII